MWGWWRWALIRPDGVEFSWIVDVSASVNLSLHHKVQKFSSGLGTPGWSWNKGHVCVCYCSIRLMVWRWCRCVTLNVLVAVSKGMWAVKFCSNKILHFLTRGVVPATGGFSEWWLLSGCVFVVDNYCYYCALFSWTNCHFLDCRSYATTQRPFHGPLSGTTRVSRCQKKHSPTHHPDHHPIFISFFHLPWSIASSLFRLCAWQSFCTTSFHVLFGLPLGLEPSTSYSIHFFTQWLS